MPLEFSTATLEANDVLSRIQRNAFKIQNKIISNLDFYPQE